MTTTPYEQSVAHRRAAARAQRAEGGSLADYGAREQGEWLGGARPPANGQLAVFRAVRGGDGLQPGDYVTNSRAYAQQHLSDNLGGEGRVIEAIVHLDEIFPADGPKEFWYLPRSLDTSPSVTRAQKAIDALKNVVPLHDQAKLKI